jgi:N6-adenosine-specific RNA methylase IME4
MSLETIKTIYADPPWAADENRVKSSSYIDLSNKYSTMSIEEIKRLQTEYPIAELAHLYMWVTSNWLPAGLEVMEAWGFKYITNIVWVKTSGMGIGNYFRNFHEICLFGRRGVPKIDRSKVIKSVLSAPRRGHSVKPIEMYDLIEQRSPGPYLELFARHPEPRENWSYWGNESDSQTT